MKDDWQEAMACLVQCPRCQRPMAGKDERILSVYDHQPICMACKKEEEQRADYDEVSKGVIGQCMLETEVMYGDPAGYCYHHFYPWKC